MSTSDDSRYEFPDPPPPLVPVSAVRSFDMRGSRVVIGNPGQGWRADLRADDPLMREGKLLVPVLPESDFYHSEDEGVEAMAALHPADSVWVERPDSEAERKTAPRHLFERLVDAELPPTRYPVPASEMHGLTGRRMWYWRAGEFVYDMRCACEAYENSEGDIAVNLCSERDWYRWARTGTAPIMTPALIHLVWAEG